MSKMSTTKRHKMQLAACLGLVTVSLTACGGASSTPASSSVAQASAPAATKSSAATASPAPTKAADPATVGADVCKSLPKEFPIPSGAKITTCFPVNNGNDKGFFLEYTINDKLENVSPLYRKSLSEAGYEVAEADYAPGGNSFTIENKQVSIVVNCVLNMDNKKEITVTINYTKHS